MRSGRTQCKSCYGSQIYYRLASRIAYFRNPTHWTNAVNNVGPPRWRLEVLTTNRKISVNGPMLRGPTSHKRSSGTYRTAPYPINDLLGHTARPHIPQTICPKVHGLTSWNIATCPCCFYVLTSAAHSIRPHSVCSANRRQSLTSDSGALQWALRKDITTYMRIRLTKIRLHTITRSLSVTSHVMSLASHHCGRAKCTKGRFTHSMPCPYRVHAVPCR